SGFERMQYVALHTAGEQCQLFRLKSRGTFQIWTRENLVAHGFIHEVQLIILSFILMERNLCI
ncbi:MAG: hypothetical protein SO064_00725, partial [Prevotella sp.]|nr:hypothetical protein [Prevotella sp.]